MKTRLALMLAMSLATNAILATVVSDLNKQLNEFKTRPARDTTPRSMDDLQTDITAFELLENNNLNRLV